MKYRILACQGPYTMLLTTVEGEGQRDKAFDKYTRKAKRYGIRRIRITTELHRSCHEYPNQ